MRKTCLKLMAITKIIITLKGPCYEKNNFFRDLGCNRVSLVQIHAYKVGKKNSSILF